ncbi:MAG: FtsW/RodA/SpoVE family cell cycle protein, partial [Clostridiales bacterium]|nr:FtsW/RodA/SpoVE family cell cycle protein [Clostridiales bacterium]
LCALMWAYVIILRTMRRKGFELEIIAFFLSTLSLAVTSSCLPDQVFKQFIAIGCGVALFFFMCTYLRDLDRTIEIKKFMYIAAALLLLFNLVFATTKNGASNWIQLGGFSFQPSEIVKLAFIWVGAASMDELFRKKNSLIFTGFSVFCFDCLALMGDFGTAIIFFVTFLIISFLRSGDFTKLILIVGVAFVGGLLVIRFKSYVADRFAVWGHVWEYADSAGYQQTRTMSAAASGGFVGLGAGKGWLRNVVASETDLVFGVLAEEWGLIIAIMAVMAIITLSIFAFRSIWAGRSTYYTIAACSAMSLFLFQTILNVFGSVDLFPLTGVTFPFVASGGTSMIASWGLLAFLKAADTRQNASIAVSMSDKGLTSEGGDEL